MTVVRNIERNIELGHLSIRLSIEPSPQAVHHLEKGHHSHAGKEKKEG